MEQSSTMKTFKEGMQVLVYSQWQIAGETQMVPNSLSH